MKYCTRCGKELDDDFDFCPKCGTKVQQDDPTSDSNGNVHVADPESSKETVSPVRAVILFFSILAVLAVLTGVILLIVGGIQEYNFRSEYHLFDESEASINAYRQYSKYPYSMNFLIAGGICTGVGVLLNLILIPYRMKKRYEIVSEEIRKINNQIS